MTGNSSYAALATGPDGSATAVWQQWAVTQASVWASHMNSSGTWSPPTRIDSGGRVQAPVFFAGMEASGASTAVWAESTTANQTVRVRVHNPLTGWSNSTEEISDPAFQADLYDFAVASSGHAAVVWMQAASATQGLWVSQYVPGVGWSPTRIAQYASTSTVRYPRVAVDSSGNTTAVWISSDKVWAARFVAGANWSAPSPITQDLGAWYFSGAGISHDDGPDVLFVWAQDDAIVYPRNFALLAIRYDPATGWGAQMAIGGASAMPSYDPTVAKDARGRVAVVWSKANSSATDVWFNRFDPETGWGNASSLTGGLHTGVWAGRLAVDAGGNVTIPWMGSGARASHLTSAGALVGPLVLSRESASVPQAASLPGGEALVFWTESDGVRTTPRWSRFTPDTRAPSLSASAASTSELPYTVVRGGTEPGATVTVGGHRLGVLENGSFEGLVPLSAGLNVLACVATDSWGNTAQLNLTVFHTDPLAAALVNLSTVSVQLNSTRAELAAKDVALREALDELAILNETLKDLSATQLVLATALSDALALQTRVDGLLAEVHQLGLGLNQMRALYDTALQDLAARAEALNATNSELALAETDRNLALSTLAGAQAVANATGGALRATRVSLDQAVADAEAARAQAGQISIRIAELDAQKAEVEARAAVEAASLRADAEAARGLGLALLFFGGILGTTLGLRLARRRPAP